MATLYREDVTPLSKDPQKVREYEITIQKLNPQVRIR